MAAGDSVGAAGDACALCGQQVERLVVLREGGAPVSGAGGAPVMVCDWSERAVYEACLVEGKKHQARLDKAAFAGLGLD